MLLRWLLGLYVYVNCYLFLCREMYHLARSYTRVVLKYYLVSPGSEKTTSARLDCRQRVA